MKILKKDLRALIRRNLHEYRDASHKYTAYRGGYDIEGYSAKRKNERTKQALIKADQSPGEVISIGDREKDDKSYGGKIVTDPAGKNEYQYWLNDEDKNNIKLFIIRNPKNKSVNIAKPEEVKSSDKNYKNIMKLFEKK